VLWTHLEPVDEDGDEWAVAIAIDDAGDLYVAMADYGEDSGGDNRVRRLDPEGQERWSVVLPGRPSDIVAQPGGGVIVVGRRDAMAWAQQLDVDGNLGWSQSFGDPAMDHNELTAVALTADGGVMLGGLLGVDAVTNPQASARSWSFVAAVELADGAERWQRKLSEATAGDRVHHLGVTADGTTLVTRSDYEGVVALGADGSTQWSWAAESSDSTSWLAVYPDGGFAVGGSEIELDPSCSFENTAACNNSTTTVLIERFDADRSLRWSLRALECSAGHLTPSADDGLLTSMRCDDDAREIYRFEP
jgi:hypothetical protein